VELHPESGEVRLPGGVWDENDRASAHKGSGVRFDVCLAGRVCSHLLRSDKFSADQRFADGNGADEPDEFDDFDIRWAIAKHTGVAAAGSRQREQCQFGKSDFGKSDLGKSRFDRQELCRSGLG